MNPNNNQNNPNNNQNNPFIDFNDPNLLNNAAFIHLIRQMNVNLQSSSQPMPQPMPQMGFGNWNTPQHVQDTPQQHFDRQQLAPTPPRSPDIEFGCSLNSLDDDEPVFEERVGGRDAARKVGSSGSGGKEKGKARYQETFDNLTVKLEGLMDISKERVGMSKKKIELSKMRMKTKESEIKLAELQVLTNDYSHLQKPNRSIMMKAQQDIREKYGYL